MNPNRHFYLYAKGHYKRSENTIDDLLILQSEYSGCHVLHLSVVHVYERLISITLDHLKHKNQHIDFFCDLLPYNRWRIGCDKDASLELVVIKKCLSVLMMTEVFKDGVDLLNLGEADPNILPLKEKCKSEEIYTDRTHEECFDCAKGEFEPPQCKGHAAGPSSCPDFIEKLSLGDKS